MCCRRDGQNFFLSSKKSKAMYEQRKKPQKIAWTQAWRRLHKKNVDNRQKKKVSPFLYLKKSEHGVGSPPPSSDVGRWSHAGVCWLGWLVSCDGISTLGKGNGVVIAQSPPPPLSKALFVVSMFMFCFLCLLCTLFQSLAERNSKDATKGDHAQPRRVVEKVCCCCQPSAKNSLSCCCVVSS